MSLLLNKKNLRNGTPVQRNAVYTPKDKVELFRVPTSIISSEYAIQFIYFNHIINLRAVKSGNLTSITVSRPNQQKPNGSTNLSTIVEIIPYYDYEYQQHNLLFFINPVVSSNMKKCTCGAERWDEDYIRENLQINNICIKFRPWSK